MDVLGKKSNSRSMIWNYFGLKLDADRSQLKKAVQFVENVK